MAGENDIAVRSIGFGGDGGHAAQITKENTVEALLKDSVWQMAKVGLAFQKPYGESLERQKHSTEADPAKQELIPVVPQKYEPIKRFGLPSQIIDEAARKPVEKTQVSPDTPKETHFAEATVEQRQRFVEQLERHMKDQHYRSNFELAGLGTSLGGLALTRASTPAGLAVIALGIGTSLYNGYRANSAHEAAREVLRQMPKLDAQRFGHYESDINSARETTAYGYITSGGLALMSMSKVTPYINQKTSGLAFLAGIGNNVIQTQLRMPRTLSNFRTDAESWNQELTKARDKPRP